MKGTFFYVKSGKVIDTGFIKAGLLSAGIPTAMIIANYTEVYAGTDIKKAMKPLINALQDLAEPVSYAFMLYACIQFAGGKTSQGKLTFKNAVGGYVLAQWIPWIFEIIRSIKNE